MANNNDIDASRRRLLISVATGAPAMALGSLVGAQWASARVRSSGVPVRRGIGALSPDDPYVRLFKDGVAILRKRSARDPLDPTGWEAMAIQHALYCSSVTPTLQVHWGWDFLSWHRAFSWSLERVLRDAVKEPQFALPYWDSTRHRRIPAAYWGKENPLYDATREMGPEDVIPDDFLDVSGALSLDSFFAFGGYPYDNASGDMIEGNLEQSFHNNIHNWIGGNMGMFATAGFDTLFTAHHNNVDRIWEMWRRAHGVAAEPQDDAWRERRYSIVDEKGRRETVAVKDLLDTQKLGYVYEDMTVQPRQLPDPVLADGVGVTLALSGSFDDDAREPRILRFERSNVPIHPFCCRVFLRDREHPQDAAYVGTFTILPVQRGGAKGLDRNVVMQIALPEAVRRKFGRAANPEAVLVGVPLKGRAIPETPIPLGNATLASAVI
ncbi:tyrosinase family protein [Lysobacter terrae]